MKTDLEGIPYLNQFSVDGFVDCVFRIQHLTETKTSYNFQAMASFEGEILGLNIELLKGMQGGFDHEMQLIQEHIYRKGITFSRLGIESDNLLKILNSLYGLSPLSIYKMRQAEQYTAILLHQNNLNIHEELVHIKIFGHDQEQDNLDEDYNESFINLDLKNGFVYWNEKDESYRASLIKSLLE